MARTKANRAADRRFAADVEQTALPSGSTSYRRLADYELQMKESPPATRAWSSRSRWPRPRSRARPVNGIEITRNADDIQDGKRTFLMMGVHHAREWPSSEHAIESAYKRKNCRVTDGQIPAPTCRIEWANAA